MWEGIVQLIGKRVREWLAGVDESLKGSGVKKRKEMEWGKTFYNKGA